MFSPVDVTGTLWMVYFRSGIIEQRVVLADAGRAGGAPSRSAGGGAAADRQ